jgi:hypothetical protein
VKAVCDTSTLIRLNRGGVIQCLGQVFEKVLIPEGVREECQSPETKGIFRQSFIRVKHISQLLPITGLHKGEHEAISLAVELDIETLITDDEKAFRRATEQRLKPVNSYHILLLAKRMGVIPSVRAILDRMISKGEGVQKDIYQDILEMAGEGGESYS